MQTPRGGCGDNSPVIVVWEICKHGRNIMFNESSFRGNGKHWTHKKKGKKVWNILTQHGLQKKARNKTVSGEAGAVWQCDVGKLHRTRSKLWILRLIPFPRVSANKKLQLFCCFLILKRWSQSLKGNLSNSSEATNASASVHSLPASESTLLQNAVTRPWLSRTAALALSKTVTLQPDCLQAVRSHTTHYAVQLQKWHHWMYYKELDTSRAHCGLPISPVATQVT